jgi:large subunit ribosomal protein L23
MVGREIMNHIVLTPKISEKAIYLAERGIYVFEVPTSTNKIEVTKAVEAAFKVNVTDVNMIITKGKIKRYKQILGRQKDVKKAMVKLQAGQKISLFEGAQ